MSMLHLRPADRGVLFVVSGPSGAGKSTLIEHLRREIPHLGFSVSATTRPPRPGDVDGQTYHFLTDAEFEARIAEGALYEYAQVYGRWYGTPRAGVDAMLGEGRSVVLDIDVQGSAQVRRLAPDAVHVFILPPDMATLASRLNGRGTDAQDVVARRLSDAGEQLRGATTYDYLVLNDDLESAKNEIEAIFVAETARRSRRDALLQRVLAGLDALGNSPSTVR